MLIILCLELLNKLVLVTTVLEAKWTQHEKQPNLCSIGRKFYPISIIFVWQI